MKSTSRNRNSIQALTKLIVCAGATISLQPLSAWASIDQSAAQNSADPSQASSVPGDARAKPAHWSLPFEGELNGDPTDKPAQKPAAKPVEKQTVPLTSKPDAPHEEHPFPIALSYHVLTLSAPLLEEGDSQPIKSDKIIKAQVSAWEGPIDVNQIITYLVDKNFETSMEAQKLDQQVQHFEKLPAKAVAVAKDSLENNFNYQGFDPSIRASKLILDKKYHVRNNAWAQYERQKYVDKVHLEVVTSMMQIAEGLGMSDKTRGAEVVAIGKGALQTVVGPEEAERSVKGLTNWLAAIKVPNTSFDQAPWSTIDRNKKLEEVVKTAIKEDPVVNEVTSKLEHYANPGKVKAAAAHVVETTLNGIAIFGPGFAIPAGAVAIETSLRQATGGTEENKLERELLLDKRIQSRLKVVSQEAALALDNYRFALVTKNPPLLAFSQEILGNMSGKSNATKIVSAQTGTSTPPNNFIPALR